MDLSILIVSFNTRKYIDSCLSSIFNYKGNYKIEVIVVDNNSSDDSVEFIKTNYPKIKFISNAYNYGFSTAMNQAFKISEGEFIMSFNPDAEISSEVIDDALQLMKGNPEIGKVSMAVDEDGIIELPHTTFPAVVSPKFLNIVKSKFQTKAETTPASKVPFEVDWLFGTGIIVRRNALKGSNVLYDECSFLFWEEYWLSKKIRQNGYKLFVLPNIAIKHHGSVSFKFDPVKLYYARALSAAVGYNVRTDNFNRMNSRLNSLILMLDNMFIWLFVETKNIFNKNKDPYYYLSTSDYSVQFRVHRDLLIYGSHFVKKIIPKAIHFFNNGVNPVYPPVTAYCQNIKNGN